MRPDQTPFVTAESVAVQQVLNNLSAIASLCPRSTGDLILDQLRVLSTAMRPVEAAPAGATSAVFGGAEHLRDRGA